MPIIQKVVTLACSLLLSSAIAAQGNVAPLGTATQSSNWTSEAVAGAFKAIDGNTDGDWTGQPDTNSVQHTSNDQGNGVGNGFAWWQVALDRDYAVQQVTVWNRTDASWESRLRAFTVRLFDDGVEVWSARYSEGNGPTPSFDFLVGGVTGDLLRVQLDRRDYLHMAEVQVMAVPEPGALALMLAGLGLVGSAVRRRAR